jgi:hypothetical protein
MPNLKVKDYIDEENQIVEYNPNDVFGDLDYALFISVDFR